MHHYSNLNNKEALSFCRDTTIFYVTLLQLKTLHSNTNESFPQKIGILQKS